MGELEELRNKEANLKNDLAKQSLESSELRKTEIHMQEAGVGLKSKLYSEEKEKESRKLKAKDENIRKIKAEEQFAKQKLESGALSCEVSSLKTKVESFTSDVYKETIINKFKRSSQFEKVL